MSDSTNVTIRRAVPSGTDLAGLLDLLIEVVDGGASVGFLAPLGRDRALEFWGTVRLSVERGERVLLVAEDGAGLIGTVQVVLAMQDNQPHRGEVAKMLVHPRARRRGVAAALLEAAESEARAANKSLLVLDTVTGSDADRLYTRLGWRRVGEIPGFALLPRGGLAGTTFFYRDISEPP